MSSHKKQGHRSHSKSLIGRIVHGALFIATFAYRALVLGVEGVFWLVHGLWSLGSLGRQAYHAAHVARTGVLRCPDGHVIPVSAGSIVHACSACGFRYRGSPLRCPNSECEAPVASVVSCPTCSLSVQSGLRGH